MTDDELEARMRRLLAEILGPLLGSQPEPTEQWVSIKAAVKPLGYSSYDALYAAIQGGLFRQGKEIRDRRKPGAKISRIQVNLVAAQKRLNQAQDTRRPYK
jgi:hypothetical protein